MSLISEFNYNLVVEGDQARKRHASGEVQSALIRVHRWYAAVCAGITGAVKHEKGDECLRRRPK